MHRPDGLADTATDRNDDGCTNGHAYRQKDGMMDRQTEELTEDCCKTDVLQIN